MALRRPAECPRVWIAALDCVTFEVGAEKTYIVHKDLLINASRYIKAVLEHGIQMVHELTKVSTDTFDIFLEWLYFGKLVLPDIKLINLSPEAEEWDDDREAEHANFLQCLLDLYDLASSLDILELRRAVVRVLFWHLSWPTTLFPDGGFLEQVYENLQPSSQFKRVLVHDFCRRKVLSNVRRNAAHIREQSERFPPEFLLDCMERYSSELNNLVFYPLRTNGRLNIADYYEQDTN
ncbi:hypothetical protein BDV96DRAFT_655069 [Lophiotrema nucula]|uniref:BTB domain-containing protein n=1 Tax=Lophiotrema nucula TaxID=690887 RepID=A0A6A5YG14_9PLEO|nr:hypothetical protein BDV96DRAFT_655069 [Lophiotrema nucula]